MQPNISIKPKRYAITLYKENCNLLINSVLWMCLFLFSFLISCEQRASHQTEKKEEKKQQVVKQDSVIAKTVASTPLLDTESTSSINKIKLPKGFKIALFATGIKNARSMTVSPSGTVYVGNRRGKRVYALQDKNKDYRVDEKIIIADNMKMPNGVAFRNGDLYVAEVNRILRFEDIESNLTNPSEPIIIYDRYPSEYHHGWKFIAFGPDDKLYVPVGAPCNVCERENKVFSTITRMNPDGSNMEVFAAGVRNSVGFDWHPDTKELWFTDNGRDMMGDDMPSDELNHAPKKGLHFGFPYCHQGNTLDPEFGKGRKCSEFEKPKQFMGAHVAALGMRFYTGNMFPKEYHKAIFIAQHGSWNRSSKVGYRIMVAKLRGNEVVSYEPFATGWLEGEEAWGRPVDVQQLKDGSLLVSDDFANVIYRIYYEG